MRDGDAGEWPLRGRWRAIRDDKRARTAAICCPTCGGVGALHRHTIAADGSVSPQVICSIDGCSFVRLIKLEGWIAE